MKNAKEKTTGLTPEDKKEVEKWEATKRKELNKIVAAIKREQTKIENSFMTIAFSLHKIYREEHYKVLGYSDIYGFAKNELNMARGTSNNYINIVERFAKRVDGVPTNELADDFKDYSASKLTVLLGLSDKDIKAFSPEMSTREMKEKKKELTADDEQDNAEQSNAEQSDGDETVIDVESKEIRENLVFEIKSISDIEENIDLIKKLLESGVHELRVVDVVRE